MNAAGVTSAADVRAAAAGDREACGRLVRATQNVVSAIALAIVRDVPTSEDVAQEVFVHAIGGIGRLRAPESFLPWLRQLTRNRAHQALREGRRRGRLADLPGDALLDAAADPAGTALDRLADAEDRARLSAAIEALPDETREVITLFYREGRSVEQVAALLGMREDAVRKRLSRARECLREAVLDEAGAVIARTAPDARFGALVLAALPPAGSAGAAGAAGATAKLGTAGKLGTIGKLAAPAAGIFGLAAGSAAGVAGLLVSRRREIAGAIDEEERRGLRRYYATTFALLAIAGAGWAATVGAHPVAFMAITVVWMSVVGAMGFVWLPRIEARRLAADPEGAARWLRRRRIGGIAFAAGALWWAVQLVRAIAGG